MVLRVSYGAHKNNNYWAFYSTDPLESIEKCVSSVVQTKMYVTLKSSLGVLKIINKL